MQYAQIKAVSGYIPENVINPDEYLEQIDANNRFGLQLDFVSNVCGIKEMRRFGAGLKPSDCGTAACNELLGSLKEAPQIDALIYCGMRRDFVEPSTAHKIANNLKLSPSILYDLGNACMSVATAMQHADAYIQTGLCKHVLICTSDQHEEVARDIVDRINTGHHDVEAVKKMSGAFTAGDAAGAFLLGPSEEKSFLVSNTRNQPSRVGLCHYELEKGGHQFYMSMSTIAQRTLKLVRNMSIETLASADWDRDEIDVLLTHQIGAGPFVETCDIFGVSPEQTVATYQHLGNVATCTLPIVMNLMLLQERLKEKDKVFFLSTGSGIGVTQKCFEMPKVSFSHQAAELAKATNIHSVPAL